MSLTRRVVFMIGERGPSSTDDLAEILRDDGFTWQQVNVAIQNARARHWLESMGKQRRDEGEGSGSRASIYKLGTKTPPPAQLTDQVAEAVCDRGQATVDDLQPIFPDHTRTQLARALIGAATKKLVRVIEKGSGSRGGVVRPGLYGSPVHKPVVQARPCSLVASVFDISQGRPAPEVWPPETGNAQVYLKLSAFDEAEEAFA